MADEDGQRALDEYTDDGDGDDRADVHERLDELEALLADVVGTVEDVAEVQSDLVDEDDDPAGDGPRELDGRGFQ